MTAIIIDDGVKNHPLLKKLLSYCSVEVDILASAYSIEEGIEQVKTLKPDLIFLDIQFPGGRLGFELLEAFEEPSFQVIFISGFEKYAVNAVRFGALDYLVKPIKVEKLEAVLQIAKRKQVERVSSQRQIQVLLEALQNLKEEKLPTRISISTLEGVFFKEVKNIVRLEAQEGYTNIIFTEEQKGILASINLGEYEEQFKAYPEFMRVHRSYMVNLNYVESYIRSGGGYLILKDGRSVDVSKKYKEELMERLSTF